MVKVVVTPSERRASVNPRPLRGLERLLRSECRRRPGFSSSWLRDVSHEGGELVECYACAGAEVRIVSMPTGTGAIYELAPWEYGMADDWVRLVLDTIKIVSTRPSESIDEGWRPLREHVRITSDRILRELSESEGISLGSGPSEMEKNVVRLSGIVARYTVGLGIFEILLSDERIEDIYVDAPASDNPIHVTLNNVAGFNSVLRCPTNIIADEREVEALVSRLRHYSGKPFSEAFPVMETDVEGFEARATVIGPPLSPYGPAVALRRHSSTPWTLTRLIANGTMDAFAAGLISFLVDGNSTILICGARGSGKSSLLSAVLFELPLSQRILVIEDTMEIPVRALQELGYNVQSLLVEGRLNGNLEKEVDDALRISLRLGESAIVLGEVRGREAQTLYQSMRTGKAGSAVLGTIHGQSAESVYERVVHDMGISGEAFSATDVVITLGLHRPRGSHRHLRKLIEVAECARSRGPGKFNQLLAEGSGEMSMVSETVGRIARAWRMDYDEAVENIKARGRMRQSLVEMAREANTEYLSPSWVIRANDYFWSRMSGGMRDYDQLVEDFDSWLRRGQAEAIG